MLGIVSSRATSMLHLVRGDPARGVQFSLYLLTTHLLRYVGYANPEHAYRRWAVPGLVVNGQFDFICLVDIDIERLF